MLYAGCEISYLAPRTSYHLRVAAADHLGRRSVIPRPARAICGEGRCLAC